MIHRIKSWLGLSDNDDAEIQEEVRYHLDRRAELNRSEGMTELDAKATARRAFGNATHIHEEVRRHIVSAWAEDVVRDMQQAVRSFLRSPGFTAAAIGALALGIGSSAAVFSFADRMLFRPLPYRDAERIVWLGMAAPIEPNEWLLGPDFLEWRDKQTVFESFTAIEAGGGECDLTDGEAIRVRCRNADAAFLETFGVWPLLGRGFTAEENRPESPPVALLSHALWQSRFGGRGTAIGSKIDVNGRPTQIIGVLPREFEFPTLGQTDMLVPMRMDEARQRQRQAMAFVRVFGKLKAGVAIEQARASLTPLFQNSLQHVPPQFRKEVTLRVSGFRERQTRDSKTATIALLAAVGLVLLVACANVSNLMLARSISRARESAIRAAIGASSSRLMRQVITENLVLSFTAGVLGSGLAALLLTLLKRLAPSGIPRLQDAALDGRVMMFLLAVCVACAAATAVAGSSRRPASDVLTGGARLHGPRNGMFRQALVSLQIALTLMLLAGAGLLLRSLWRMQNVDLGVATEQVLVTVVDLNRQRYPNPAQRNEFWRQLESRMRQIPGVQSVSFSDAMPPSGRMMSMIFSMIEKEGIPLDRKAATGGMVSARQVTPDYFATLKIPILRGRAFQDADRTATEGLVIVDERLAGRLFAGQDVIGKRIRPGLEGEWHTIVGVARNAVNAGLFTASDPEYYVLDRTLNSGRNHMAVRTARDPAMLAPIIRSEIQSMDSRIPIETHTLDTQVATLSERPRFNAWLLTLFAAFAVGLSAIGLAGVVSFLVTERTREIGVRLALGATAQEIRSMIVRQSLRWVIAGTLLGLVAAWAASKSIKSLLFGVDAGDPATFGAVTALLVLVALAAAWMPALRASRLDPMSALRQD